MICHLQDYPTSALLIYLCLRYFCQKYFRCLIKQLGLPEVQQTSTELTNHNRNLQRMCQKFRVMDQSKYNRKFFLFPLSRFQHSSRLVDTRLTVVTSCCLPLVLCLKSYNNEPSNKTSTLHILRGEVTKFDVTRITCSRHVLTRLHQGTFNARRRNEYFSQLRKSQLS